jgi:adenylate cyclase
VADPTVDPGELPEEAYWRDYLTNGDPKERRLRRVFVRLPTGPRCNACAVPFAGLGGRAARLIGKRKSDRNPNLCNTCFDYMIAHQGGATIEITMLFADVRGSTTLAEGMSPSEFQRLMRRFYHESTEAVFSNDGEVDKFVGDEIVAMFFPLASGDQHASKAIDAAREILRRTGHGETGGPWLRVGAGVHTGEAWVGAIGSDTHVEMTAIGDAVNTAARLASVAAAGEILVSVDAARSAGLPADLPRTSLALKGKEHELEVVRLGVGEVPQAAA